LTQKQFSEDFSKTALVFDTRKTDQYEADHIPGAKHMEWREVIDRVDEIPADHPVVLYDGTCALAAQAAFALRLLGYKNVLILRGGYLEWQKANQK
jgi:rhodanese-related sulfurtransferase